MEDIYNEENTKKSDDDNQRIISVYKEGVPFELSFIRSLNFDASKRECLDYNECIQKMHYYSSQVKQFTNYIDTMRTWYK